MSPSTTESRSAARASTHGKRHPNLGDRVVVGAGAKVLGPITVGDDSRIGANAVVVKTVPPDSVVVGVPGEVVERRDRHVASDLDHGELPDVLGETLISLLERVAASSASPASPSPRRTRPTTGSGASSPTTPSSAASHNVRPETRIAGGRTCGRFAAG